MNSTSHLMNSKSIFSHCAFILLGNALSPSENFMYSNNSRKRANNLKGNSALHGSGPFWKALSNAGPTWCSRGPRTPPWVMYIVLLRQDWGPEADGTDGHRVSYWWGRRVCRSLCSSSSSAVRRGGFAAASGSVCGEGISQVRGIGFHSHINSSQVGAASRRACTEGIGGCARLSREELCNQGSPSATFGLCCCYGSDLWSLVVTYWRLWINPLTSLGHVVRCIW